MAASKSADRGSTPRRHTKEDIYDDRCVDGARGRGVGGVYGDLVRAMTINEICAVTNRVTYKPDRTIYATENGGVVTICVDCPTLVDVTAPERTIHLLFTQTYPLEYFEDEAMVLTLIRDTIQYAETHEISEWLKLDGKCVKEPHP
jgi:hypothetical protein